MGPVLQGLGAEAEEPKLKCLLGPESEPNFNPIRVKHIYINLRKKSTSKKGNFQGILKNYLEPGPETELEPESQFGLAAPRSRNRKKYFRLHNTA